MSEPQIGDRVIIKSPGSYFYKMHGVLAKVDYAKSRFGYFVEFDLKDYPNVNGEQLIPFAPQEVCVDPEAQDDESRAS